MALADLKDPIDWAFFDVGYTLLDETAAWDEQFHRLARAIGATDAEVAAARMWRSYDAACVSFAPKQWRAVVASCASSPADIERLLAIGEGWRHDLETVYPGVADALARLAGRFNLGVIANQHRGTRDRLERHGLLNSISLVISSAEAGVVKPDLAIFQTALAEAGCAAPRAVMVGDRIDNDIRPANLLGMRTIHVRQGGSGKQVPRDASDMPTASVATLAEIVPLLG